MRMNRSPGSYNMINSAFGGANLNACNRNLNAMNVNGNGDVNALNPSIDNSALDVG